ncbi:hypothetical protein ACFQX4_10030 [Roseomonas sp. GCM10028921]
MSAIILPFARRAPVHPTITREERARAAAWAASLVSSWGGDWWVEAHAGEEGELWLGVVTPSSGGAAQEDRTLSWLLSRTARGVVLTSMPSGREAGLFPRVSDALAAIEQAEKAPRRIAYGG